MQSLLNSLLSFFRTLFCSDLQEELDWYEQQLLQIHKQSAQLSKPCKRLKHLKNKLKTISLSELSTLFKSYKIPVFYIADKEYYTLPAKLFKQAINWLWKDFKVSYPFKYKEEVFDCDNYSLAFVFCSQQSCYYNDFQRQLAIGVAWSTIHAFNIFITQEREIYVFEPQNGFLAKYDLDEQTAKKLGDYYFPICEIWFPG